MDTAVILEIVGANSNPTLHLIELTVKYRNTVTNAIGYLQFDYDTEEPILDSVQSAGTGGGVDFGL